MNVATFKQNLKTTANKRQAALFAQADALDARACKEGFETAKRCRLHAQATDLRNEAARIGDRYHELVGA